MLETIAPELLPVLAERLKALGDPLRLRIMQVLAAGERTVGELVERIGTTQPNISRHLARLEQAGWIVRRRAGAHVLVRLADEVGDELCATICGLVRRQAEQRVGLTDQVGR